MELRTSTPQGAGELVLVVVSFGGGVATTEPHTSASLTVVHGGATAPSAPRTWAKAMTFPSLVTCTTGSAVESPSRWDW